MDALKSARNLLALAARSTNTQEAENAYAAAQRLMFKHGLSLADVNVQAPDAADSELGYEAVFAMENGKMPAWISQLAHVICKANRCKATTSRRRSGGGYCEIRVWGPRATLAEIRNMFDHVRRQVDHAAERDPRSVGKAGKRAFRLGAVARIGERLQTALSEAVQEAQNAVLALPADKRPAASTALQVYATLPARIDAFYTAFNTEQDITLRKPTRVAPLRSATDYERGRVYGDGVGMSARKALPEGRS